MIIIFNAPSITILLILTLTYKIEINVSWKDILENLNYTLLEVFSGLQTPLQLGNKIYFSEIQIGLLHYNSCIFRKNKL